MDLETWRSCAIAFPSGATLPDPAPEGPRPGDEIPSHYPMCIGCGGEHPAGLHLRMRVAADLAIEGEVTIDRNHQGSPGIAHGGLLSTVLDEAMGALNFLLWKPSVTSRLEVQFRRPVPVGSVLRIRTHIAGVVGRRVFTQGTLSLANDPGEPAVVGAGLFIHVPLEHFATHGEPWPGTASPPVAP